MLSDRTASQGRTDTDQKTNKAWGLTFHAFIFISGF